MSVVGGPRRSTIFSNTKSIALDGVDDYVAVSSSSGLNFTGDFTLSVWIKTNSIGNNQYIIDTSTSGAIGNGYSFRIKTDGKIRFWSYHATQTGIDSTTALSAGSWYHIACVHTSTQNKIYINGSLDATLNWSAGHSTSNTTNLRIGGSQILAGTFNGKIDEVAFFNSDQSTNVSDIYNGGLPNNLTSLSPISWYRCGDGDTSPTLTDNGSESNDGTMANFTTFSTDVPT
jgi:hypothetical protein